jgi:hypothetical protein
MAGEGVGEDAIRSVVGVSIVVIANRSREEKRGCRSFYFECTSEVAFKPTVLFFILNHMNI